MNVYHGAKMCEVLWMDNKYIRLQNFRLLRSRAGNAAALAKRLRTSPATVSQIFSPNPTRGVGDELARRAEEVFGLNHGWMDLPHADEWREIDEGKPARMQASQRYSLPAAQVVQRIVELDAAGVFTESLADTLIRVINLTAGSLAVAGARQASLADVQLPEIDDNAPYMRKALQDMQPQFEAEERGLREAEKGKSHARKPRERQS
jgi:hypothetical protein